MSDMNPAMNAATSADIKASSEMPAAPADDATAPDVQHARLLRLFRHTLASGLLNPLLLIVPAYRDEAAE